MPVPTKQQTSASSPEYRKLHPEELDQVSGGFKWKPVYNPDVIDATGGSGPFMFGLRWALGKNGFRLF